MTGMLMRADASARAIVTPDPAALGRLLASHAWYAVASGDDELAGRLAPGMTAALPAALAECDRRLVPAPNATVMIRLGSLLALTAGVGMTEAGREEWLAAAADGLRGVPPDLLERGVRAARPAADHPSKVLPSILAEIMPEWRRRRSERGVARRLAELARGGEARAAPMPPGEDRIAPADVARTNQLMRKFGCRTRFRADGTAHEIADDVRAVRPARAA